MAVSKGGSSKNQRQNQSGAYNSQSTSTPIAPEGWETAWNSFAPGPNGFSGPQQGAVDWMTNQLGGGDPANLQPSTDYFKDALANRTAPTLRNLAAIDPTAYGAPASISPQTIEAQQIAARRGSEFMDDYQNAYMTDVVDASLASYDQGANEARNSLRAGNAGAFGNKRYGVAEGQFAADSALGRAQLGAGLRSDAFNTAANFGMADAGRTLVADQSNQQANLTASQINAANAMAAEQFNNNMLNQRQMFDANMGMSYNDQRDRTAMNLAGLGTTGFNVGQGLASGIFDAGTTGQGQNMQWLAAGTPLFGQENTGSGSTSGSSTGSSKGKSGGVSLG